MNAVTVLGALVLVSAALAEDLAAQSSFGAGCAGASGVTPTLGVSGIVRSGQTWNLEVAAPGGLGLGYLIVGFSNTSASALGGLPLPLDLGVYFGDPLWSGCTLDVDPSYAIQPYAFDPNASGGVATFGFPGFDFGTVFVQAVNLDPDFTTRIAGVSRGLAVRRTPPSGMVSIGPGTFAMGSNAAVGAPYSGPVGPVHSVSISSPFWMGAHEVTQAEYTSVMGSNPSFFVGANRPVDGVSWFDARAYCAALTIAAALAGELPAGYEYRLPTEAEWEYACRAGTTTEFNVGAELLCSDARIRTTQHRVSTSCGNPSGSVDVGGYAPNAWGLFDMHGNVAEWCLDSFASYDPAPATDPFVTCTAFRVVRGGSWLADSASSRSASRSDGSSVDGGSNLGFRVVLAPIVVP